MYFKLSMRKFKCISQNDEADCGPACLAAIFRKYNLKVSIATIRDIAGTDRKGTSAYGLVKAIEYFKFQHKVVNADKNALTYELPLPAISYISQNTFLFSGSIKENLLFGNPVADDKDISRVCQMCELEEYINSLPLKYNTRIEENGKNLSGGQKQRIAIARALLTNPQILIMDEATSNLDYITEKTIENTINKFSTNMTTIIIAHRLSTIKNCDKIFVFKDGQIVENGNHKDLLNQKGYYFQLWNGQDKKNIIYRNDIL